MLCFGNTATWKNFENFEGGALGPLPFFFWLFFLVLIVRVLWEDLPGLFWFMDLSVGVSISLSDFLHN